MNMKAKMINPFLLLLTSVLFIGIGIFILIDHDLASRVLMEGVAFAIAVAGITHAVGVVMKHKTLQGICVGMAYCVVAGSLFVLSWFYIISYTWIFALWFLCIGIIRGVIWIYALIKYSEGRFISGVISLLSLGFAIILFINPFMRSTTVLRLVGIYMIFYGITALFDFFSEVYQWEIRGNPISKRVRIPLPVYITAFIPSRLMTKFNQYFREHNVKDDMIQEINAPEGQERVDLEVFIHLCGENLNEFGHADLCYGDTVYSYGAYDETEHKCFGMFSQGTIVKAPREPYICHCLNFENKILVGFGLCLSDAQKRKVEEKITEIMGVSIPWQTRYEQVQNGLLPENQACKDAASELVKATGAKIFKVKSGAFKTYFSINTNCVKLADYITGSAGIDVLDVSGIVTPGSYYALLNNLFERRHTIVVTKTIYRNKKDESIFANE